MIELTEARSTEDYAIARSLFEEYAASLSVDLCFQGFQHELEQLPRMYGPPGGCLILGREMDVAVACVAIRRVAAADCEMKRLFVKARARGFGLGRRLTLEAARAARHLYATLGFEETEPYYPNPVEGAYFMVLDVRSH